MGMSPADIKFINEMKVGHLCDAFDPTAEMAMKALDVILQQAEWYFKMKEDQALRAAMSIAQIAVTDGVSPDTRLRLEHHFAVLSGFMQPQEADAAAE